MALNYQRNSYVLWECANRMYADNEAKKVFDSKAVCLMPEEQLKEYSALPNWLSPGIAAFTVKNTMGKII